MLSDSQSCPAWTWVFWLIMLEACLCFFTERYLFAPARKNIALLPFIIPFPYGSLLKFHGVTSLFNLIRINSCLLSYEFRLGELEKWQKVIAFDLIMATYKKCLIQKRVFHLFKDSFPLCIISLS